MKKFIFTLIAACLVGFVCFACMYWIFNVEFNSSLITAISVAFSGLVVEYIKPLLANKRS